MLSIHLCWVSVLYPLHPITFWKKLPNQMSKGGGRDSGKGGGGGWMPPPPPPPHPKETWVNCKLLRVPRLVQQTAYSMWMATPCEWLHPDHNWSWAAATYPGVTEKSPEFKILHHAHGYAKPFLVQTAEPTFSTHQITTTSWCSWIADLPVMRHTSYSPDASAALCKFCAEVDSIWLDDSMQDTKSQTDIWPLQPYKHLNTSRWQVMIIISTLMRCAARSGFHGNTSSEHQQVTGHNNYININEVCCKKWFPWQHILWTPAGDRCITNWS